MFKKVQILCPVIAGPHCLHVYIMNIRNKLFFDNASNILIFHLYFKHTCIYFITLIHFISSNITNHSPKPTISLVLSIHRLSMLYVVISFISYIYKQLPKNLSQLTILIPNFPPQFSNHTFSHFPIFPW